MPENPYISDSVLYTLQEGWKRYELTNHLGNVLAVITDRKRGQAASGTDIQWYEADVMAAQQYYPFGMLMPTSMDSSLRRQYSLNAYDYRYGFNGKEGDDEIKGDDNQQDYGMRIYDPRVGRFLSVDPIAREYPWYTPYQFAGNTPIQALDLDGREPWMFMNKVAQGQYGQTAQKIIIGSVEGVAGSLEGAWNFVARDAWKAETWKQAGLFLEEIALSSSPYSGIYNPNTPKLDAAVQSLEDNVINGDAYSRSKFVAGLTTDILIAIAGDKGISRLKSLAFSTQLVKGVWITESTAGWSAAAKSYQEFVTGVKAGNAIEVGGVRFDGIRGNTLLEAKSSYDNFVSKGGEFYDWFKGKDSLLTQARGQLKAAGGTPIEWNFKTQKSLDATKKLFKENGIEGIDLKYTPQE